MATTHDDVAKNIFPGAREKSERYHSLKSPVQREALRVERQTIIRLRNERVINDDALRHIQRDLDLAETGLTGG